VHRARGCKPVVDRGVLRIPFFFKQVAALHPTDEMIPEDLRIREYPV
jgi:hypothetical protein